MVFRNILTAPRQSAMNASMLFSRLKKTNHHQSSENNVNNEDFIKLYQQLEKLTLETHNQQQTINAMKQKISDLEVRNEQLMETQQQLSFQTQTKQVHESHEENQQNKKQQEEENLQQKQQEKQQVVEQPIQQQTNIPVFSQIQVDQHTQTQQQQSTQANGTFYVKDALAQMNKRSQSQLIGESDNYDPHKISTMQIRVQQQQQRQEQTFNSPFGGYQQSSINMSKKHAEFEESDEEEQKPKRKSPTRKIESTSVQRKISKAKILASGHSQSKSLRDTEIAPEVMSTQHVPQPQQIHKQVLFEDSLLEESFDEKTGVPIFKAKIQVVQPPNNIPKPNLPVKRQIPVQRPKSPHKITCAQIMQPEIRKNGVLTQKIKLM